MADARLASVPPKGLENLSPRRIVRWLIQKYFILGQPSHGVFPSVQECRFAGQGGARRVRVYEPRAP